MEMKIIQILQVVIIIQDYYIKIKVISIKQKSIMKNHYKSQLNFMEMKTV